MIFDKWAFMGKADRPEKSINIMLNISGSGYSDG
jgi:hypothetical protein